MGSVRVRCSFIAFIGCNPWFLLASGDPKHSVAQDARRVTFGTGLPWQGA